MKCICRDVYFTRIHRDADAVYHNETFESGSVKQMRILEFLFCFDALRLIVELMFVYKRVDRLLSA